MGDREERIDEAINGDYTPGPWTRSQNVSNRIDGPRDGYVGPNTVAVVSNPVNHDEGANANLIAAAPDLAAAYREKCEESASWRRVAERLEEEKERLRKGLDRRQEGGYSPTSAGDNVIPPRGESGAVESKPRLKADINRLREALNSCAYIIRGFAESKPQTADTYGDVSTERDKEEGHDRTT